MPGETVDRGQRFSILIMGRELPRRPGYSGSSTARASRIQVCEPSGATQGVQRHDTLLARPMRRSAVAPPSSARDHSSS